MWYRRLILALVISFALKSPTFAQDAPQSPPLSNEELRAVAVELANLKAAEEKLVAKDEYINQLKDLAAREAVMHNRELDIAHKLLGIAERERDVEKARGDQLEAVIKQLTKKPSKLCRFWRGISFGLGRCG